MGFFPSVAVFLATSTMRTGLWVSARAALYPADSRFIVFC
jgi:hypothetical protein